MKYRVYERDEIHIEEKDLNFNQDDWEGFQQHLWQNRLLSGRFLLPSTISYSSAPYLKYLGSTWEAQEYVGFLSYQGLAIEIIPRYFRPSPNIRSELIYQHIFYLLAYCQELPGTASLGSLGQHAPQPGINFWQAYFEKSFLEQLQNPALGPYASQVSQNLGNHGRPDLKQYTENSFPKGQWQDIPWQGFRYDQNTLLYQVLKAVATLMLEQAQAPLSRERLGNILAYLEPLENLAPQLNHFEQLKMQAWPEPWPALIEYAQAYWQASLVFPGGKQLTGLSWMLPMPRLFEAFIANFLQKHFPKWSFDYQKRLVLGHTPESNSPSLYIRPDLWFPKDRLVVDIKYKYLSPGSSGPQASDVYQLISYAQRLGAQKAMLLYPHPGSEHLPARKNYILALAQGSHLELAIRFLHLGASAEKPDKESTEAYLLSHFQEIFEEFLS